MSEILSGQQEKAMHALMSGQGQGVAAKYAGCSRETVNRWVNHDEQFIAEYKRRCDQLWERHFFDIMDLVPDAIGALKASAAPQGYYYDADLFDPRVRLAAALAILRIAGMDPSRSAGMWLQVVNNVVAQQQNAAVDPPERSVIDH